MQLWVAARARTLRVEVKFDAGSRVECRISRQPRGPLFELAEA